MNKLWAAVLTGLLACSCVGRAADPTPPTSPYSPAPVVTVPAPDDAKEVKKKTETIYKIDPMPVGSLKPVPTKWADERATPVTAPAPLAVDVKATVLPASHACGACAPSCGACATAITPKPCETCASAKPCGACGGCGLGGGKLRGWFSYHPPRTPLGECVGDYRIPPIYTFFLDVPCHETWKPVACPEQPCDRRPWCGKCGSTCGGCAPAAPPAPVDAPLPEPLPVMPRIGSAR